MSPARRAARIANRLAWATGLGTVVVAIAALTLDRLLPFPFDALDRPAARVVRDHAGVPLRFELPPDEQWRIPFALSEIDPELVRALIVAEDRFFDVHPGVNPLAIARASLSNLRAGRTVSGASTIPMQLARWAEPRPRTLVAKLIEAGRALQIRAHWSRDAILDAYLNRVPLGGNIEGVGAAAWFYFGKRPTDLSLAEIALLVALPRAPPHQRSGSRPAAREGGAGPRHRDARTLRPGGARARCGCACANRCPGDAARRPSRRPTSSTSFDASIPTRAT